MVEIFTYALFAYAYYSSSKSKKKMEAFNKKRVFLGYTRPQIFLIFFDAWQLVFVYSLLQLYHLIMFSYLDLLILMIMILVVFTQIVKTEKQFKRYSGHYSIKPPEGFYD
jgi:type IV secretory pathway VirB3-like protein